MFLRLVHVGRGSRDVRRTASQHRLLEAASGQGVDAAEVLRLLCGGQPLDAPADEPTPPRLLVTSDGVGSRFQEETPPSDETPNRKRLPTLSATVDLVHDILLDEWQTLRDWLTAARRDLERREDLEAAAATWVHLGRRDEDLPSAGLVAHFAPLLGQNALPLTDDARDYLARAQRRERRRRWRTRVVFTALTFAAARFASLGWYANQQRGKAEANAQLAEQQRKLALDTLRSVIFDIQRGLENVPGAGEVRRRLLQTTFERLEKISDQYLTRSAIDGNMAAAAVAHEATVRTINFAGAVQTVAGVMGQATPAVPGVLRCLALQKLVSIASRRVGHRPNRVEPRAIKRRPKSHKLLTKPRDEPRAELGVLPVSRV